MRPLSPFFFCGGATAVRRGRSLPAPPAAGRRRRVVAVLLPSALHLLLRRRGNGDQARWLPADSSGGRAAAVRHGCSPPAPLVVALTVARRGRTPLGSSGGGFTATRSGRSLPVLLAVVATVARRERVPPGSSGVEVRPLYPCSFGGGVTAARRSRSSPSPPAAGCRRRGAACSSWIL